MRNWLKAKLRDWLGLEEERISVTAEIQYHDTRIDQLYTERQKLVDDIMRLEHRCNELEQTFREFNMTPKIKLAQLRSGINILTQFANELQREIEE